MADEERVFRMRLWPLYRFGIVATPIASLAYGLIRHGTDLKLGRVVLTIAIATVVVLLLLSLLPRLMPVKVRPDGLAGQDMFGAKCEVAWEDVIGVNEFSLLGMRYWVVLSGSTGRKVFVPKFLREPEEFRASVARRAGDGHLLAKALSA